MSDRPRTHNFSRRGFTLTELLVVISAIVLMIAMAVPLFNVMSGSGSIGGGENLASAMLQRARARAIAMQERRGVLFFEDQVTRKTGMLLVKIDEPLPPPVPTPPSYVASYILELDDQDEEIVFMPTGVGAAFILGATPTGSGAGTANAMATTYRPYGLIAFDGVGRIINLGNFTTEAANATRYPADTSGKTGDPKPPGPTNLAWNYNKNIYPAGALNNDRTSSQPIGGAVSASVPQEHSHAALLLFDKTVYADVQAEQPPPSGDWRRLTPEQSRWLDQNGTAVVVNRYNGTLIKGE